MSSEIAGSRMLTAEVFAFTTSVEMQVAASTPPARAPVLRHVTHPASFRLEVAPRAPTVGRRGSAGPHPLRAMLRPPAEDDHVARPPGNPNGGVEGQVGGA